MNNVMVDLETLGTKAGCSILSIGAVFFDPAQGLGEKFYKVVSKESCMEAGLNVDLNTLSWWDNQSEEAQKVLNESLDPGIAYPLDKALKEFNIFLATHNKKTVRVWGNGADFDNPILISAYDAVNVKQGWGNWNGRCYRTLKGMYPNVELVRGGVHHNALDDAITQATHAVDIFVQMAADKKLLQELAITRATVL